MNRKLSVGKREIWILVALAGIFLLLVCNLLEGKSSSPASGKNSLYDNVGDDLSMSYKGDSSFDMLGMSQDTESDEIARFCSLWENKIEGILSCMKGVGKADVILYSRLDERNLPDITGVFVLAQGAGDVSVEVRIKNALRTLLGISEMQVSVQTLSATESPEVR